MQSWKREVDEVLTPITVPPDVARKFPSEGRVLELIDDANTKIERFYLEQDSTNENFVVSDFHLFDSALRWIEDAELSYGNNFLEWGSAFGVATLIASLRGWRAAGIEIEEDLQQESVKLADHWGSDAQFACGSFLPAGSEDLLEHAEDASHVSLGGVNGYDELSIDLDDVDLVFIFPWPGESDFIEAVFDRYANSGAMLMSYRGRDGMHVLRKT